MNSLINLLGFLTVATARVPLEKPYGVERIVGGKNTDITETPYQIALYSLNTFICGGSIISTTYILTAAHCISKSNNDNLYIRAGSSQYRDGVLIRVKKATTHSKYLNDYNNYDVGILELSTSLNFSDSIKAIKIADKEPEDGELVKASGWGCTKEGDPATENLQSVVVPIVNRETCGNNYKKYFPVTRVMICAGVEGKDACQGDSGGSLTYKDTLVGIACCGFGCGRRDYPGVYTNVVHPEIRKFIKDYIYKII